MKMRMKIIALMLVLMVGKNVYAIDTTNLVLLDQIEAVVYGQENVKIITTSDINRPKLSGGYSDVAGLVFENTVLLDAEKHKIPQDEEAVNAYLAQIQRDYNLSEKELEQIFTSAGYTVQEGREQLQIMQTVSTMFDIKIRSNLIIPRKDVEAYYNDHPEVIEASYTIQRMFVPYSDHMASKKQYAFLCRFAKTGKGVSKAVWGEPFTINHSDIAENKKFIYDLKVGEVSLPQEVQGGFELFKLVEKVEERLKTFDESYREIVDILRRPKYDELMEKYRQYLSNHSSVIYF